MLLGGFPEFWDDFVLKGNLRISQTGANQYSPYIKTKDLFLRKTRIEKQGSLGWVEAHWRILDLLEVRHAELAGRHIIIVNFMKLCSCCCSFDTEFLGKLIGKQSGDFLRKFYYLTMQLSDTIDAITLTDKKETGNLTKVFM